MIRRDYLLRMIDQCVAALTRCAGLVLRGEFETARGELDQSMRTLSGLSVDEVAAMPESELLALLLRGEPTQMLRQRCMLVVALLRQAGDARAAEGRPADARACYLKALHLQLQISLQEGPFEAPEFVPRIEALVSALVSDSLPVQTTAALMQYYERSGDFGKAEDALYSIRESEELSPSLREFGIQFYERLARRSDTELELGNLPRSEVEAGLDEWRT
jgi:hypothetical protein